MDTPKKGGFEQRLLHGRRLMGGGSELARRKGMKMLERVFARSLKTKGGHFASLFFFQPRLFLVCESKHLAAFSPPPLSLISTKYGLIQANKLLSFTRTYVKVPTALRRSSLSNGTFFRAKPRKNKRETLSRPASQSVEWLTDFLTGCSGS